MNTDPQNSLAPVQQYEMLKYINFSVVWVTSGKVVKCLAKIMTFMIFLLLTVMMITIMVRPSEAPSHAELFLMVLKSEKYAKIIFMPSQSEFLLLFDLSLNRAESCSVYQDSEVYAEPALGSN